HEAHGQLQEPLVEGPFEHDRPLDEMDDLLEYVGRVRPAVRQPFDDSAPPLVVIGLDVYRTQYIEIRSRRVDLDRLGMLEPMAERGLADDGLGVELREQPAHRPGEAEPAVVPAHRPPELESADDRADALGNRR